MGASRETRLRLVGDLRFTGTTPSGHQVQLDSRIDGAALAATPMDLQLIALGGCTAMDTISILRKMREDVTAYDVRLSHERAVEHPRVFTAIQMVHEVHGRGLSEANVQRAIQLTMLRYCPIFAMLSPTVEISERYEIIDDGNGSTVRGEVSPDAADGASTA